MSRGTRSINGRVAVVTGGARGIGKATATALAAAGARVAIGDLDRDAVEAAAAEIGHGAIGLRLDVTDRPGFSSFLDEVERQLGPLDILVNNAGIMPLSPLEDETDASTTRQLDINLHAVIHGTKEAVRRMKPRRTGHILNISSGGGKIASSHIATYVATKFGVVGYSESAALELHGTGVEISVVYPSITRTELASGLKDLRGVSSVSPETIADGIVAAIRRPRFDVPVPRSLAVAIAINGVLPHRVRAGLARTIKSDSVMVEADKTTRAAYEARAAASSTAEDATPPAKAKAKA